MKPLHLLYSFPTRVGTPGIGMIAWHHVAGLSALGVRVTLCCGSCERPVPGLHELVETMRVAGIPIPYRLLGDDRAFRFHDRAVARLLRSRPSGFDAVHGWPLGSLATLEAARDLDISTFLERPNAHTRFAYEVVAQEHQRLNLPVPRNHTHAFNAARLEREEQEYAAADRLLCPSDFVLRTFAERGYADSKLLRHQYGFDPASFRPAARPPDRCRRFTAVFAGRCEPRKGLHYALEAWHASGAAEAGGRLIICGDYVPGYRERLLPLLSHPSIEERGFVPDVQRVMQDSDVHILPSVEEGSALVTYESRACGCVLLASEAAGATGADGDELLLHPTGDVRRLSQQLHGLSSDCASLDAMRRRSLSGVQGLTWHHAAQVLHQAYGSAAATPAPENVLPASYRSPQEA